MALILCIETATGICSVAIGHDGKLSAHRDSSEPYTHVSLVNQLVEECLVHAQYRFKDLDAIAVSEGPGSYTGLRVGVSTAKGFCLGLQIPLLAISTLESLAWGGVQMGHKRNTYLCPVIDARRMEVYTATYDEDLALIEPIRALVVQPDSFDHLLDGGRKIVFMGDATPKMSDLMAKEGMIFSKIRCSAENMISISEKKYLSGQYSDISSFVPTYLKSPHITKAKKFI